MEIKVGDIVKIDNIRGYAYNDIRGNYINKEFKVDECDFKTQSVHVKSRLDSFWIYSKNITKEEKGFNSGDICIYISDIRLSEYNNERCVILNEYIHPVTGHINASNIRFLKDDYIECVYNNTLEKSIIKEIVEQKPKAPIEIKVKLMRMI